MLKSTFSSKYTAKRTTFTSLDTVDRDIILSEPVCIEPTISGTKYLFPISGKISAKELGTAANDEEDDDDDDSNSSGDEVVSDEETETHITTTRTNVFPKIVILGTGSTFPGVTKTVTAILVHTA